MLALSRCLLIVAFSSFWRTLLYVLYMLTVLPKVPLACAQWIGSHASYIYIYIYAAQFVCKSAYQYIYIYIQAIYTHIRPWKYMYRLYVYVFCTYLLVFMLFGCWICANICKWMQMHAHLHIIAQHGLNRLPKQYCSN